MTLSPEVKEAICELVARMVIEATPKNDAALLDTVKGEVGRCFVEVVTRRKAG